eukprot:TRINITY_DN740_c0_g1_i5.p2 TRINITY_DN740_c0_g1~~TRINITY_DN740_c0_g1_i5.p2  ORF type:complete len:294 (+),score=19.90 TRINITY_DN740_c0_g1_i5:69-950(+)
MHYSFLLILLAQYVFTFSDQDCGDCFVRHYLLPYFDLAKQITDRDRWPMVYYINGSKPGQQFVLCTTPKSGSTRTKSMMDRILHLNSHNSFVEYRYNNTLAHMPQAIVETILDDANIPKVAFVRNPYIRALSMYTSKIAGYKSERKQMGFVDDMDVSFEDFLITVQIRRHTGAHIDKHFRSQTEHCRIRMGMTYDYILQMEKMPEWFDCFMDLVNIREEMMEGETCFLSTEKSPCAGPSMSENVLVFENSEVMGTQSARKLDQHYNEELQRMVKWLYYDDFVNFNYSFDLSKA